MVACPPGVSPDNLQSAVCVGVELCKLAGLTPPSVPDSKSIADDVYQHPFSAAAVEFAIEDLFPRPKIQFAGRDRHNDFAAHDLAFHVSVGIVLAIAVVLVVPARGQSG